MLFLENVDILRLLLALTMLLRWRVFPSGRRTLALSSALAKIGVTLVVFLNLVILPSRKQGKTASVWSQSR